MLCKVTPSNFYRRLLRSLRPGSGRALVACLLVLWATLGVQARSPATNKTVEDCWALAPVVRPKVPDANITSHNPIDAFIAAEYQAKTLRPAGPANKATLLRRLYLDLIGIPPTLAEQDEFLQDSSPEAYDHVVDRLLASEQHAVRYARHWLDVLRYADVDDAMVAAPGIYLWRDWIIRALQNDLPYDQFVRAQLTGYRTTERSHIVATGFRLRVEPRPEDMFALGFLARGGSSRDVKDDQELAMSAVETVSTAFMGMTVGCAKCHDHEYDPILQRDYYAMKALFDPLVLRKVTLATAPQILAHAKAVEEWEARRTALESPVNELIAPYKKKLYDDRVAMLPPDVREIILKPEKERTPQEQKIADDYYPTLRIDSEKVLEILPDAERKQYEAVLNQLDPKKGAPGKPELPAFWTVEVDRTREQQTSFILTSGNPDKPEKNHPVEPGWPFAPAKIDFREGRVEAFSDWLTAPENPLFARVAVNRLWQWHFGQGLKKLSSDFGHLGGTPSHPQLLDWLASEFVKDGFSMKKIHRLIVTSDTYKLASDGDAELVANNVKTDPDNTFLWHFRLQRLEAEPVWDSILAAAGNLDLSVGGPSFDVPAPKPTRAEDAAHPADIAANAIPVRRAAYMTRGFSSGRDAMYSFLPAFDVDDGRAPCPLRTQTVTAPQALFLMNSHEIEEASTRFASRLQAQCGSDLSAAVDLAYRIVVARSPSPSERKHALAYLENQPARLKPFSWLLFNLDEFIYVR